jgi:hypothetical protein
MGCRSSDAHSRARDRFAVEADPRQRDREAPRRSAGGRRRRSARGNGLLPAVSGLLRVSRGLSGHHEENSAMATRSRNTRRLCGAWPQAHEERVERNRFAVASCGRFRVGTRINAVGAQSSDVGSSAAVADRDRGGYPTLGDVIRRLAIAESWLEDSAAAEESVLHRWGKLHLEVLGFSAAVAIGIARTLTENGNTAGYLARRARLVVLAAC